MKFMYQQHLLPPKLTLRQDGFKHGWLSSEKLAVRALQSTTCPAILAQKNLLEILWQKMDTDFTDWPILVREVSWVITFNSEHVPSEI